MRMQFKMFSRTQIISIGKCVRNAQGLSAAGRRAVVAELCKLFKADNQTFPEQIFRAIANAKLEEDYKTQSFRIGDYT